MHSVDMIERGVARDDLPAFRAGDTVRVHVKIKEGEKERTQVFEGVVLRRRRGGSSATFTVRKISYGVGVERIFPVESPSVEKVEIKSRGHVRRSRLYYLRALRGKKARLRAKLRDLAGLTPEPEQAQSAGTAAEALEETQLADEAVAAAEAARAEEAAQAEAEEQASADATPESDEQAASADAPAKAKAKKPGKGAGAKANE